MKLIIQIPCYNEAETLPITFAALPSKVDGFDTVEVLVVDDGSTDGTAIIAKMLGVDHIVHNNGNQGLARAFMVGLTSAISLGADVIVNTDADNQYMASDIPQLVSPILKGQADLVVGVRPIRSILHFSPFKRFLQGLGSRAVRSISGTEVGDAPSGFRAISRNAAQRLNVFGRFTYTIETLVQAGLSNLRVVSIPISVNPPTRPSRLFRSNVGYIVRAIIAMTSTYIVYQPSRIFGFLSSILLFSGLCIGVRYFYYMAFDQGKGHIQSLIACSILVLSGVFVGLIGIVAFLLSINRRILEDIRYFELSRYMSETSLRSPASNSHIPCNESTNVNNKDGSHVL